MRRFAQRMTAVLVLAWTLAAPDAYAAIPIELSANGQIPTLAPIIKKVAPGVVSITVRTPAEQQRKNAVDDSLLRQFFGLPEMPQDMQNVPAGSGVVFDRRLGLIVTNNHVVENADLITVTLPDGREAPGVLQGSDPDTDIALVKVALPNLPAVVFGDSDRLEIGDYVLAIGNPFGIGQTVTSGIVSGLRRTEMGLERYEDFIQTDASINPGNSGGALVNLRGEVVGINAAIVGVGAGNAGIGFAIPINMVRAIADQLVKYGSVERGELGFAATNLRADLSKKYNLPAGQSGAVINRIDSASPAERAGLQVGDLVTSLASSIVRDSADLRNKLGLMRVGETADLSVWRNGKAFHVRAALAEPKIRVVQGAQLSPLLDGAVFSSDRTSQGEPGLQVVTVRSGSNGWNSGLREGDLVTTVNQKMAADPDRFAEEAAKTPERLILSVLRNGESLLMSINSKGIGDSRPPR
jgi:Do/DeqQ family serine protease